MKLKIHFSHKEELWNSWSHAGGILMGVVVGAIFLYWCFTMHNGWATAGIILYLFGMLMSYIASTTYHAISAWSKWKERLRKWDHAAIYWHIARLFPYHPDCDARTRLLGMEPLYLHLGMRHSRHGDELCQTQGPQQSGDALLCGHGIIGTCRIQASDRFRIPSHGYLDYRRGRLLHHGCRVLQYQQEEIHALRVPLLRPGR